MNRHTLTAIILASGTASSALAQIGTATVTWEANDGSGWTSGRLLTTATSVEIRMKAEWTPSAGYGFAGMQFDALVTSLSGGRDIVTDARRLGRFAGGSAQTLAVSRFGDQVKIDDSRDTFAPGLGPRGLFPGQIAEGFPVDPPFDRSNPALIFSFRLTFDTTPGARMVNSLYIAPSGGDTISRYMRIYTTVNGAQNTPSTTTLPLEVVYIPSPGVPFAIAALPVLLCSRRRR